MTGIRLGAGREFDLIRRFLVDQQTAPSTHVRVGPGDDGAVIDAAAVALSVDLSVEGIHFRRDWLEPEEIGYRATAAALSDLAAMAATPIGVLVALAVAADEAATLAPRIMSGCSAAAGAAGAALIGGDLTRSPGPIIIDVVAAGEAVDPVLRSGAQPGDAVWVTGSLGGAAAAVRAWQSAQEVSPAARAAFARPTPRTSEARWLADRARITSLIDLSDGLGGDAAHLAAASGVRIIIEADTVPLHPATHVVTSTPAEALQLALGGGEDYELCFTAALDAIEPLRLDFSARFGIPLTQVGRVAAGSGVSILDAGGASVQDAGGYDHFEGVAG